MSRWYRAYEGTVTDAKLGEIALTVGCSRSVIIATWHSILEACASANQGGKFTTNPRRVAAILNEPLATIEGVFFGLTELGMVTADGSVTQWQRRQFESDSSTERSRKHRSSKRNGNATLHERRETLSNADATPPENIDRDNDRDSGEPNHSSTAKAADGRLSRSQAFEIWYKRYPNKKGRIEAVKAFEKVSKQRLATFDQLMLGLERYLKYKPPQIDWCHPAVWLNKGRWLDEYPNAPPLDAKAEPSDPRVDFGGGYSAPLSSIRANIERGFWPDQWGAKLGEPGCRVPERFWGDLLPKKPEMGRLPTEMVH